MKLNCICHTDGRGLWTAYALPVKVTRMECHYLDIDTYKNGKPKTIYAEFHVYFTTRSWDVNKRGLIYTDPLFLKELQKHLVEVEGFSIEEVRALDYTENGMQGRDYVSIGIGGKTGLKFWKKWESL